jgi:hypothetical protein
MDPALRCELMSSRHFESHLPLLILHDILEYKLGEHLVLFFGQDHRTGHCYDPKQFEMYVDGDVMKLPVHRGTVLNLPVFIAEGIILAKQWQMGLKYLHLTLQANTLIINPIQPDEFLTQSWRTVSQPAYHLFSFIESELWDLFFDVEVIWRKLVDSQSSRLDLVEARVKETPNNQFYALAFELMKVIFSTQIERE